MQKKLSLSSAWTIACSAVVLVVSIFFPWWGMDFYAPQYPEGLDIVVYPYKMEGKIEIINGLNHYIGMKPFAEETFPELQYLPYIIVGLAAIILIAAIIRSKKFLYVVIGLFGLSGVLGIYDIHRWLKDFGTNLDPMAPIELAPFVPPIFGENTIANFVTYSYFATGSFLMGLAFIILLIPLWRERKG